MKTGTINLDIKEEYDTSKEIWRKYKRDHYWNYDGKTSSKYWDIENPEEKLDNFLRRYSKITEKKLAKYGITNKCSLNEKKSIIMNISISGDIVFNFSCRKKGVSGPDKQFDKYLKLLNLIKDNKKTLYYKDKLNIC